MKGPKLTPEEQAEQQAAINKLSPEDREWFDRVAGPSGSHTPPRALRFLNKIRDDR